MSERTRTRTRLPPEQRRAQILDVATDLVSRRGYNAFTMTELAKACGITRAGVEHHFPSSDALLIEILRQRDDSDVAFLAGRGGDALTEEATWRLLDDLVERNAGRREIVRLYTMLEAESLDPHHPAHDYFAERATNARSGLAEAAAPWHPDPEGFAIQVLACQDGLQLQWLRDPSLDLLSLWRSASMTLARFAIRDADATAR